MITDPAFYAVAVPALLLTGLSKGGFLAGIGGMAVPLMSLVISPVQAAGIMLPILIAMDWVGVFAYRRDYDAANLKILLPAGAAGTLLGFLTASYVSDTHVRLIVGAIGLVFALDYWLKLRPTTQAPGPNLAKGAFWGTVSAFTSFVSHTGGPPFAVYLLPQRLPTRVYAATSVMYFTTINLLKVVPYGVLGQLNRPNMMTSLVLLPLAFMAIGLGIWLVRRVPQDPFYRIAYAGLLLISLRLLWDGTRRLMAA